MRFNHATCRLCGAYIFDIKDLIAYSPGDSGLYQVDLKGQQPWTSVHCVCKTCVVVLAATISQTES